MNREEEHNISYVKGTIFFHGHQWWKYKKKISTMSGLSGLCECPSLSQCLPMFAVSRERKSGKHFQDWSPAPGLFSLCQSVRSLLLVLQLVFLLVLLLRLMCQHLSYFSVEHRSARKYDRDWHLCRSCSNSIYPRFGLNRNKLWKRKKRNLLAWSIMDASST